MQEPLTFEELKELARRLRRMEKEGRGWPVVQTANALHISRDFIYDAIRSGQHFELMPGVRPMRLSARSILKFLIDTYHGGAYFDAFAGD